MNLETYRRILGGEQLTAILSPRALWRLTGPDAGRYLNGQVTNDVSGLRNGQACYAAVCTAKGRMEGDVTIAVHADAFHMDADLVLRESLGARLEKYLIADDAVFEDVSEDWSLSHVFGINAPLASTDGFVIHNPRFGLPGHDVWRPAGTTAVSDETVDANVLETLRLEHAIPRWGHELTTNTLPPEAGPRMLQAISYTKGCYVGQETIARLKSVGHVNRTLVLLQSDSVAFPPAGARIMHEDAEVGAVTSSGYSPRWEKGIALGYVQRRIAEERVTLQADGMSLTLIDPLPVGVRS